MGLAAYTLGGFGAAAGLTLLVLAPRDVAVALTLLALVVALVVSGVL